MALQGRHQKLGRSAWHQPTADEGEYADAERRVQESCLERRLSNRRYRRWANDRLLRELAPPLDALEIGGLFAPPPWGERNYQTPLEQLTEGATAQTLAAWEPLRNNVDMDIQAEMLQKIEQVRNPNFDGRNAAEMSAWRAVDRTARQVLRRSSDSPLLSILEEKLLIFLNKDNEKNRELVLEVGASYHRLLLHGLSQFHGLISRSDCTRDKPLMYITKRKNKCGASDLNLSRFLHDVRHSTAVYC